MYQIATVCFAASTLCTFTLMHSLKIVALCTLTLIHSLRLFNATSTLQSSSEFIAKWCSQVYSSKTRPSTVCAVYGTQAAGWTNYL